jgi:sugar phosphate isomerase/epimerase
MNKRSGGNLNRRDLLRSAGALVPLASLAMVRGAQNHSGNRKRDRLACNSWPFRAYFDTPQMHEYRDAKFPLLTQAEFPQFLVDHFQIYNVEFLRQHFADTEPSTIEKVKAGLKKANSRCCNLMDLEIPGGVYTRNSNARAVSEEADRWVKIASTLDCPSITVALTGKEAPDPRIAAHNLKPFVDVAHKHGIKVLFHNDNMKTESAEILTAVIAELGQDRTGTCPDFGNFATKSSAFALSQLRMLAPYASTICHSKEGIADQGRFYADDFAASMKVMRDIGFKGLYSLEFEGLDTPLEGVQKLLNLTEKYLD